jgi:hypothetical protein
LARILAVKKQLPAFLLFGGGELIVGIIRSAEEGSGGKADKEGKEEAFHSEQGITKAVSVTSSQVRATRVERGSAP